MQNLINYIQQFVKLQAETIDKLNRYSDVEYFEKNELLLEAGQKCNKIWFIDTGMIRKYYLHDDKELSTWIHTENETFTSLQSYWSQAPSNEYLQACEPCRLISISRNNSQKLAACPEINTFTQLLIEKEMVQVEEHTRELRVRDAKDKYAYFCRIAPEVVRRAKLGHIASILGITQETLSRIRKA